jgi:hypothetical protein
MSVVFDFNLLDDLAFAAHAGVLPDALPQASMQELGPVMELTQLRKAGLSSNLTELGWLNLGVKARLLDHQTLSPNLWIEPKHLNCGIAKAVFDVANTANHFELFCIRAQQSAERNGIPKRYAQEMIAAIWEFQSNIIEHSDAPETGFIAFQAHNEKFEFVAADSGIGVLESLRSCTEYRYLNNHGDALLRTIEDGVSKSGSHTMRGLGFRPIFVGLANLNGAIRLRSGDYALISNGTTLSRNAVKLKQKPKIAGFFASIVCDFRT